MHWRNDSLCSPCWYRKRAVDTPKIGRWHLHLILCTVDHVYQRLSSLGLERLSPTDGTSQKGDKKKKKRKTSVSKEVWTEGYIHCETL